MQTKSSIVCTIGESATPVKFPQIDDPLDILLLKPAKKGSVQCQSLTNDNERCLSRNRKHEVAREQHRITISFMSPYDSEFLAVLDGCIRNQLCLTHQNQIKLLELPDHLVAAKDALVTNLCAVFDAHVEVARAGARHHVPESYTGLWTSSTTASPARTRKTKERTDRACSVESEVEGNESSIDYSQTPLSSTPRQGEPETVACRTPSLPDTPPPLSATNSSDSVVDGMSTNYRNAEPQTPTSSQYSLLPILNLPESCTNSSGTHDQERTGTNTVPKKKRSKMSFGGIVETIEKNGKIFIDKVSDAVDGRKFELDIAGLHIDGKIETRHRSKSGSAPPPEVSEMSGSTTESSRKGSSVLQR